MFYHESTDIAIKQFVCIATYGTAQIQRRITRLNVARCTLELDVCHLESVSLQLKARSTLGL